MGFVYLLPHQFYSQNFKHLCPPWVLLFEHKQNVGFFQSIFYFIMIKKATFFLSAPEKGEKMKQCRAGLIQKLLLYSGLQIATSSIFFSYEIKKMHILHSLK